MASKKTPPHSIKLNKRGDRLEVRITLPRHVPESVLNIKADENGLELDTGSWGGGYHLEEAWPENVKGKVKAGGDVEVNASLEGGILRIFFEVEQENANGKSRTPEEETKTGKSKQQAQGKKKDTRKKQNKRSRAEAVEERDNPDGDANGAKPKKKKKAIVSDKSTALSLMESIVDKAEAEVETKLQKEKQKNEKIQQIMHKRNERKSMKQEKKTVLLQKLKEVSSKKQTKAKEEAPATKSKKKRVSWGQNESR